MYLRHRKLLLDIGEVARCVSSWTGHCFPYSAFNTFTAVLYAFTGSGLIGLLAGGRRRRRRHVVVIISSSSSNVSRDSLR